MLTIAAPVIAVALTTAFVVPRGQRRAVWRAVGFHPRRGRGLLRAVLGPMAIIAVSFGVAAALGVVRFPGPGPEVGQTLVQHSPMFPVVDLVYLSLGTVRVSGDVVTGAAFWSAAVMDLAVLVGWVALGLMVIRRTFRWASERVGTTTPGMFSRDSRRCCRARGAARPG